MNDHEKAPVAKEAHLRAVFHCRSCAKPLPEGATDCPLCGRPLVPPGDHRATAERGDAEAQFLQGLRHRGGFDLRIQVVLIQQLQNNLAGSATEGHGVQWVRVAGYGKRVAGPATTR